MRWNTLIKRLLPDINRNNMFTRGLKVLSDMHQARTTFGDSFHRRRKESTEILETLLTIQISHRDLGVCEPKDIIYAHLGVSGINPDDSNDLDLMRVDYDQPSSEILTNFTLDVTSRRGDLDILSLVEDRRAEPPSWVADRTMPSSPTIANCFLKQKLKAKYSSTMPSATLGQLKTLVCVSNGCLRISQVCQMMSPTVNLVTLYEKFAVKEYFPTKEATDDVTVTMRLLLNHMYALRDL